MDKFQQSLQLVTERTLSGSTANVLWRDVERRTKYNERTKYDRRRRSKHHPAPTPAPPPSLPSAAPIEERALAIENYSCSLPPLKQVANDATRIETLVESGCLHCAMPTHYLYDEIKKEQDKIDARNHHEMFEELPFEDSQLMLHLERELNARSDQNNMEEASLLRNMEDDGGPGLQEPKTTTEKTTDPNLKYGSRRCLDLWCLVACNDCSALVHVLDRAYTTDMNSVDYRMPHGKSQTALHVACRLGDPHCCVALLSRGARFYRKDDDGATALDLAVMHGHRKCVELLLAFGASCAAMHASIDVSSVSVRAKGRPNARTVRFACRDVLNTVV